MVLSEIEELGRGLELDPVRARDLCETSGSLLIALFDVGKKSTIVRPRLNQAVSLLDAV